MVACEIHPWHNVLWIPHSCTWCRQKEIFYMLLALCDGNPSVTDIFFSQIPVTRRFDVFFELRLNKRSSKQSRFETSSRSSRQHCNAHFLSKPSVSVTSPIGTHCHEDALTFVCDVIIVPVAMRYLITTNFSSLRMVKYILCLLTSVCSPIWWSCFCFSWAICVNLSYFYYFWALCIWNSAAIIFPYPKPWHTVNHLWSNAS